MHAAQTVIREGTLLARQRSALSNSIQVLMTFGEETHQQECNIQYVPDFKRWLFGRLVHKRAKSRSSLAS